ncbi:MAG: glycosyltransferase family 4 protein [Vicinamibacterales bacterium]
MKIVHVCGWYFPDSLGGTETYVASVAACLHAAGHHVAIAAPAPGAASERTYTFEGLPVYRYPIAGDATRDEAQHTVAVRGAERFHAWLQAHRPDVAHFHTFVTGVGPHEIRAARAAGARIVVTTHSGSLGFLCQRGTMLRWGRELCDGRVEVAKCAACALQQRGMPRPAAALLARVPVSLASAAGRVPGKVGTTLGMPGLIARNQALQRQMLADVDAFVVLSEWARATVVANDGAGAPIVLNRLGVRIDRVRLAELRAAPRPPRRKHLRIAYVGRFDRIKGVHDLARAIRALPAGAQVACELRGPVSNLRDLAVADELKRIVGPDAWVRFGEPIEPAGIFDYLRDIDLLCCPSRTLEGGPTVALEAMAVGTPVLGTRIGALAEMITDGVNGRLVKPGDHRALARAILAVAADRAGTLDTWRRHLPPVRTMADVTRDYLELYTTRA